MHQLLPSSSMSRPDSRRELRNDSGATLGEAQAGQTSIVTRNGVPAAERRAVPQRRFVLRAVISETARCVPRVDADEMRADLDAVVDQSVDG